MQLTLEQFQQSIAAKKFAPVYFLYGEEELIIGECTAALLDNVIDPSEKSFNCDVLHATDTTADDVVTIANSFPMMSERRLVVVKEFDKLTGKEPRKNEDPDDVPFIRYIKKPCKSTVLVLVAEDPDMRRSPYAQLTKHANVLQIKKYYERETAKWIELRVKQKGKSITPDGAALLLEQVGSSLRTIDNEIEKLCLHADARTTITGDDVRHIVGISNESSVFDLEKAVGDGNVSAALRIMQRLLANETPQTILSGLQRFVTRVHKILLTGSASGKLDKNAIAIAIGANPRNFSLIDNYIRYARGFTPARIDVAFDTLLHADTQLKTTQVDAAVVMGETIINLIQGNLQTHKRNT